MNEHTELELKLYEYIKYLTHLLSIDSVTLEHIHRDVGQILAWRANLLESEGNSQKFKDLVDDLNTEFGENLRIGRPSDLYEENKNA